MTSAYNDSNSVVRTVDKMKGMVTFGVVDCTDQKDLCDEYSIEGFPTLKTFEMEADTATEYQGPRQAKGIAKYAKNLLNKAKVSRLKDEQANKLLESGTKVLLFSSKTKIPILMKGLAAKFTSYKFYIADASNEALMKIFSITEEDLPKIFMQLSEDKDRFYGYEGDSDYRMITTWIENVSTGGDGVPEETKETEHDE